MMLVEHLLDAARKRLVTLHPESSVCEAASLLSNPNTPLVLVCDPAGIIVGVISRTDVVKVLASLKADAAGTSAYTVMSKSILSCRADQPLQQVWDIMSARSLRCLPILNEDGRPQGVLHARDLASALLADVTYEENLLRDYVLGIGYQ